FCLFVCFFTTLLQKRLSVSSLQFPFPSDSEAGKGEWVEEDPHRGKGDGEEREWEKGVCERERNGGVHGERI
ncbi:hypothetical protein, partial [uncultured Bilophila sp.]|uniref:hypothetical protein n=1 Tax=uncultured Bilophila sp. TaxID=529385 RepID=UPI0026226BCB